MRDQILILPLLSWSEEEPNAIIMTEDPNQNLTLPHFLAQFLSLFTSNPTFFRQRGCRPAGCPTHNLQIWTKDVASPRQHPLGAGSLIPTVPESHLLLKRCLLPLPILFHPRWC